MHKNVYTAKTLIGNWQEERSTEQFENDNEIANSFLPNPCFSKYVPISKAYGNKDMVYEKEAFDKDASENWMQFQKTFTPSDTYKTTAQQDIPKIEERSEKFKLRQNKLTANEQAMQEYRERWTSGNHNFGRTYLGTEKEESKQDWQID